MDRVVNSSDMWNIVSNFLDIWDVIQLKQVNRASSRVKLDYLEKIRNDDYITIPRPMADYYSKYFLRVREYHNFIKTIPYLSKYSLTFKIFRHMTLSDAIDVHYAICQYSVMLHKNSWKYPFLICRECFGYNLEVFKWFIGINHLRGLDYLINYGDFEIIDEDDIIFVEYLENHILN